MIVNFVASLMAGLFAAGLIPNIFIAVAQGRKSEWAFAIWITAGLALIALMTFGVFVGQIEANKAGTVDAGLLIGFFLGTLITAMRARKAFHIRNQLHD